MFRLVCVLRYGVAVIALEQNKPTTTGATPTPHKYSSLGAHWDRGPRGDHVLVYCRTARRGASLGLGLGLGLGLDLGLDLCLAFVLVFARATNNSVGGWSRYPPNLGPIPPELIHVFGHVSVCT